ncbi:hypothetical protein ACFE04_009153 [Oxalis oulophora]
MGSCASVHHRSSSSSSPSKLTAVKLDANNVVPPSPIKSFTTSYRDFGSKEEYFFDSRTYLESDCDDDFYSVNGDFTPSRGNTPVHHSFSSTPARNNKGAFQNTPSRSTPEPSPKKKLVELFRESIRENQNVEVQNGKTEVKQTILDVLPKSANGTPYRSGPNSLCSSDRTANDDDMAVVEREKSLRSMQCCLPSLISCRSFSDRKKKMSPAIAVNGN